MEYERIEKIKVHLRENKKIYLASVGGVLAGVGGMLILGYRGNINIANPAILNWKPVANTVQVSMTRPGPKSFVIQAVETQKTWPSLRATAKDLSLNPGELSKHLKGEIPDVGGMHFKKLAEI